MAKNTPREAAPARSPGGRLVAIWLLIAALTGLAATPGIERLGLYYDEAFLAQQARDFVQPESAGQHPASVREWVVFGRPFPLRNAVYLGSLKSQLLIPAFALFGADTRTLRLATLGTALLGLLFTMLWARRIFGTPEALATGALIAFDPSFVFFGACEWGPYTTMLLCRSAGLYSLTVGWQSHRTWLLVGGGLAFGLGVYARADFVLIGLALGLGLLATRGRLFVRELRERPGPAALAAVALLAGALPMLVGAPDLLAAQAGIADRGDLAYRLQVLWSTLDGSHFYRLMQAGGVFEHSDGELATW